MIDPKDAEIERLRIELANALVTIGTLRDGMSLGDVPKEHRGKIAWDPVYRIAFGAMRNCIDDHGPITANWVASAAKRIACQIRGAERQVTSLPSLMPNKQQRDEAKAEQ